jgi:hypothetical protein
VLIIQATAALLLLLGSWLIFRALVEVDAPSRPHRVVDPRLRRYEPNRHVDEDHLPRAA